MRRLLENAPRRAGQLRWCLFWVTYQGIATRLAGQRMGGAATRIGNVLAIPEG
jgi:hypothetical protein